MKTCPRCDRENSIDAQHCYFCGCYLHQTEYPCDYSLVAFLRKNETLFTIMGIFLVLAFIFSSAQLLEQVNPDASDFIKNSTIFSTLCLWVTSIIFLVICLDLYRQIQFLWPQLKNDLLNFKSEDAFFREYSIILLIVPFIGIVLMLIVLFLEGFSKYAPAAMAFTAIEIFVIETLCILGVLISFYKQERDKPNGILAFTLANFFVAFLLGVLFVLPEFPFAFVLFPVIGLMIIFGILGGIRYLKLKRSKKNT
jgi:hypothetical protein